jgi:hypothetical protein
LFLPAFLLLTLTCLSRADEVVDCSQQGLIDALSFDGQALFTEDCSITLSDPISINLDTVIDAQGHNVSISGDNQFLVFEIQSNASLTISGVTITSGQNTNGGAFFVYSDGTLVLSNCTLIGNQAVGTNGVDGADGGDDPNGNGGDGHNGRPGGRAFGGAVFNLGDVTLLRCTLASNTVTGGPGGNGGTGGDGRFNAGNGGTGATGGFVSGGAIYNLGTLFVGECSFLGNSAKGGDGGTGGAAGAGADGLAGSGAAGGSASGAAVYSSNEVTITNCTFSGNAAQGGNGQAGGKLINGNGSDGAKGADAFGGGVFAVGGSVTNCTFFKNSATGGNGGNGGTGSANGGNGGNGGIGTGGALHATADIVVENCTFSQCTAKGGAGGTNGIGTFNGSAGSAGASRGGNIARGAGVFTIMNSILGTNSSGGAAFGTIQDGGYNISFGNTFTLISDSGSFKTNDVKLGPLTNNGGFTLTMALLAGSPALDRIPTNALLNPFPPFDQRGFPRPINYKADIGAVEFENAGPPVISQQPTNTSAMLHSNATFYVVAFGAGILKYQWRFNGVDIPKATRSSFTVTNATPATNGPYDVVVMNGLDSVTSRQVFVQFSPSITTQPANQTVAPGGTATFVVDATGDGTLRYQWQFEGEDLPGKTDFTLNVINVHQANVGNYQVIVTNDFGSVTSSPAALNLLPGVVVQPTNITAATGSTVIFRVGAEGSAPLSYQWQKNGSNAPGNATGSAYILGNVQTSDAGAYNVVITNGFGSINSATGILTVIQGIAISSQPVQVIVPANSDATFTVTATGAPPLTYQWRFNGSNLPGQTTTALVLHNVQPENAGPYVVVVTNSVGAVTSSPALLKLAGPLSITSPQIVSNRFNLVFSSQTGFAYVIEYKTNLSSPTWISLLTTNGTGNSIIVQDSSISASSRFYRIRAQ